jgi:hypothetical protein
MCARQMGDDHPACKLYEGSLQTGHMVIQFLVFFVLYFCHDRIACAGVPSILTRGAPCGVVAWRGVCQPGMFASVADTRA